MVQGMGGVQDQPRLLRWLLLTAAVAAASLPEWCFGAGPGRSTRRPTRLGRSRGSPVEEEHRRITVELTQAWGLWPTALWWRW